VLSHPFFKDIDLEKLYKKELKPSYMPLLTEYKFFNQKFLSEKLENLERIEFD